MIIEIKPGKFNYKSFLYGFLLGNSVTFNNENKFLLVIEDKHQSYMRHIQQKFSSLGYLKHFIILKQLKKGKLNKVMQLHTDINYRELFSKGYLDIHKNKLPIDFFYFFNEEALCYWLMTEAKIKNKNLYVNMKNFNNKEIKSFILFLEKKFNLEKINLTNNWLEFNSNNIKKIYTITKPYIFSSMKFKFLT